MSPEEIERAIGEIAWGGNFVKAKDQYGKIHLLIIKALNAKERNFTDFIYEVSLEEANEAGVLSKFELYNIYKTKGIWTHEDDVAVETLPEIVREAEKTLAEANSAREKKIFTKRLEGYKNKLSKAMEKRAALMWISAESYAEEMKTLAMVFCATHKENEEKMWSNWNDFLQKSDDRLVSSLLVGMTNVKQLDIKQMRQIARSNEWRFRWAGAKNVGDLFGKCIGEFDHNQQSLLYWSQVYDSVYESLERPPQSVIDDDDALDKWFDEQAKKDKQKSLEKGGQVGKVKMSNKMRGHGEIFIVTNPLVNPDAPDINEVNELNTELVRKFKQHEAEEIKKHGTLKETELRKRGDRISRKLIGSNDAVISPNSFGQAKGGKSAGKILPGGTIK